MGSRGAVFWALNEAALNAHGVTLDAIPKPTSRLRLHGPRCVSRMAFANQVTARLQQDPDPSGAERYYKEIGLIK